MGNPSADGQNGGSTHPKKWWQWFLVYPVFATSLIAAIPTYLELIDSKRLGVDYGKSAEAKLQHDIWQENLTCTNAPVDPLVTEYNIEVDATICKTGDVLVKVFAPKDKKFYRWVAIKDVINSYASQSDGHWFVKQAYASGKHENIQLALSGTVLCQKPLTNGRLLRRIQVSGQGCFDEVVNTYTGAVESTTPSACSTQC